MGYSLDEPRDDKHLLHPNQEDRKWLKRSFDNDKDNKDPVDYMERNHRHSVLQVESSKLYRSFRFRGTDDLFVSKRFDALNLYSITSLGHMKLDES
jgi:hypothetical protein